MPSSKIIINVYRFDENEDVTDNIILDWQLLTLSSPTTDVQFFIGTSANVDSMLTKFDDWIQMYFNELSKELAAFGYEELYTFDSFMEDVEHAHYHGFFHSLFRLQVSDVMILILDEST